MDNQNKEMTREEIDAALKTIFFEALSAEIPGVHMDENGFIRIPIKNRRKRPSNTPNNNCQKREPQNDKAN